MIVTKSFKGHHVGPHLNIEGDENDLIGPKATSRGNKNTIRGRKSKSDGDHNDIFGSYGGSTGDNNLYVGNHGRIDGDRNTVRGDYNVVHGLGNKVIGRFNTVNGFLYEELLEENVSVPLEIKVPLESNTDSLATDAEKTCIVCLTNQATCAALPCGHLAFCSDCSISLIFGPEHRVKRVKTGFDTCPKCRQQINEFKFMHQ